MEPTDPMPATRESHAPSDSTSLRVPGLSEAETNRIAEHFHRMSAERHVRNIFISHMRTPLHGIVSRLGQVQSFVWKAYARGK